MNRQALGSPCAPNGSLMLSIHLRRGKSDITTKVCIIAIHVNSGIFAAIVHMTWYIQPKVYIETLVPHYA